jgi:predicted nicotinamide N-methyase
MAPHSASGVRSDARVGVTRTSPHGSDDASEALDEPLAFVRASTVVASPPLLPELRLHLATDVTPLWHATELRMPRRPNGAPGAAIEPPFWAFAWAGGQALARYLLDHPDVVRGRRVVDVATGSGLCAIAAARAGAASVTAIDCDPLAVVAVRLNAALAGTTDADVHAVHARQGDPFADTLTDEKIAADVILAGDVCYDRAMATAAIAWLRRRTAAGALVLLGDPGRAYRPAERLVELARYVVPTPDGVEAREAMEGVVYRFV